nr:MAG TPA: hypothetical protein [Caudoviricetes sp.]
MTSLFANASNSFFIITFSLLFVSYRHIIISLGYFVNTFLCL